MGAEPFIVTIEGRAAQEAFAVAVAKAEWAYGHNGYTGSIAEKGEFVMIPLPEGEDAEKYAARLLDEGDGRVDDKWGPAGCIDLGPSETPGARCFLFFGWASC
jgi:hypothetical protein